MDIVKMHTTFRTLGQQMGMQLIRAILPESIDVYLNEAILDKCKTVVTTNVVTQFNDRVAIQDNSISPINSIRTLYKKKSVTVTDNIGNNDFYSVELDTVNVMYYTSFGVRYPNIKQRKGARFIEGDKLDDTRSDYCNRESWDYPIVNMLTNVAGKEVIELYVNSITRKPNVLEVSYIELPKIVKYDTVVLNRVDCNLPEHLHGEIVKNAVNLFFESVGSTTKQVNR